MAGTDRLKLNPPLGRMPVLQFILPGELQIDASYQRSLDGKTSQSLIKDIAQHWNWDLCLPLVVARRGGGLYVVDGQHRLEAARRRGDISQLPCVVVESTGACDEAATFVHLNQRRRPLSRLDEFRAAVASGDTRAGVIYDALQSAGLTLATHTNSTAWKPGEVANVGGLERAWRVYGDKVATRAMAALAAGFEGQVLKYAGTIFPGIAAACSDEMERGQAFRGDRFEKFTMMLYLRSQDDWRREVLRTYAEADGLTPNESAVRVVRRAWARASAEPVQARAPAKQAPPTPAPRFSATPKRPPGVSAQFLPDQEGRAWCDQCDRRVGRDTAIRCADRHCPMRVAA